MKIIITEEQYDKLIGQKSFLWLRRRYALVIKELKETFDFTKDMICNYNSYEEFEQYFFSVFMDCLHPYYYDDDSFNYDEIFNLLKDLFYVECTEFYFDGKERC